MVQGILLEKIQHNKPNLKEITMKILLTIIRRDKSQSLNPELFRRFKNKNIKIASFSIEVTVEALRNQLYQDETSLRAIFKAVADSASHTNKELRDVSIECIKEVYRLCHDDASTFVKNLKTLRPIQTKEVKDLLNDIEKTPVVTLFSKEQNDGPTPKKTKTKLDIDSAPVQKEAAAAAK